MKPFIYLYLVVLPFAVKADDPGISKNTHYELGKSRADQQLKNTEAVFDLRFHFINGPAQTQIKIQYNGTGKTVGPTAALKVIPGKYAFTFWYRMGGNEYTFDTDSIEIQAAYRMPIDMYFNLKPPKVLWKKPVIYLYPPEPLQVNVKIDIANDFVFTYPPYDTTLGWKVQADPDGILQQGNKTFGYLFWEGEIDMSSQAMSNKGFVVKKNELTGFLEEKLAHIGLNGYEIQDFMTYWVPVLQQHDKCHLYFMLNDEYNQYAKLTVSPKPDQLIRLMMLWEPLEDNADTSAIKPQVLPHFERKGFTLVEWGGTSVLDTLRYSN